MEWRFTIPDRPATWQRTNPYKGRLLTDTKQRAAKARIGWIALAARPKGWPLDREYIVDVRGYWPDRRYGDADRLTSLVMDALEGIAYAKDRQVADQSGKRRVDKEHPRTEVVVRVWEGDDD